MQGTVKHRPEQHWLTELSCDTPSNAIDPTAAMQQDTSVKLAS